MLCNLVYIYFKELKEFINILILNIVEEIVKKLFIIL